MQELIIITFIVNSLLFITPNPNFPNPNFPYPNFPNPNIPYSYPNLRPIVASYITSVVHG